VQKKINSGRIKALAERVLGKDSIYKRVRNINIAIFILAFVVMITLMLSAFNSIIGQVSAENACRYAASAADAFSANIVKEIGFLSDTDTPGYAAAWFADDENEPETLFASGELSSAIADLFDQFDNETLRSLIIDENGLILLDSVAIDDPEPSSLEFVSQIEQEFTSPLFLLTIGRHLDNIDGVFEVRSEPVVVELVSEAYRFATIAEIRSTPWSVVLLYNPSSFLSMYLFFPIIAVLLLLLIVFAISLNAVSNRQIFLPLARLVSSLVRLKEDSNATVYGLGRDDEIGKLSNTIVDLFTKANYDALTGIYNRHYMEATFQNIMHLLSRSAGQLSVLMLDIDFFKYYNDEYGHDKGDVCLKEVAQTLSRAVTRKGDFLARYGGEEFIVVLPNTGEAGARLIANRLLDCVRRLKLPHAGSDLCDYLTVSIGVASGKVLYTQSSDDFIKRADEALYMSKQGGRDRYTFLPL